MADFEDEEYIDMEVSSYSNFFCNSSISSPPNPREFEFQMSSSISMEKEPTTSLADELFYKGKLLPLHLLPSNLQLQNSISVYEDSKNGDFEEFYGTPLATTTVTTPTPTTTSTPFESCNISPSDSCQVSRELNPEEYFFDYSKTEVISGFIDENPKKSWTKKLNLIKQSASISSKLKASRVYLKSLFGKSGCSDETCAAAKVAYYEGSVLKAKERSDKYMKSTKISDEDNIGNRHRKSFSLAIKRHSTKNKSSSGSSSSSSGSSSSSSSSNASNGFQYFQFLKRSSSVNAEIESPIQGAIAHCKQSQQLMSSRKNC